MKSTSQAYQDLFVYSLIGNSGTYIEVGAHKPIKNSNTYNLEINYKWTGFGIEFDSSLQEHWFKVPERKNKIYWADALTFNYIDALKENNLPTHINYLSCDIEPPENTFNALKKIIDQGITFDVITFEHDLYNSSVDYNIIATEFLLNNGYKVAVTDVYYKKEENLFETWFVKNNINFEICSFNEWKRKENLI